MSTLSSGFMYKGKSRDYGLLLSAESRIFVSVTTWLGTLSYLTLGFHSVSFSPTASKFYG
jgi:hypothetical protein